MARGMDTPDQAKELSQLEKPGTQAPRPTPSTMARRIQRVVNRSKTLRDPSSATGHLSQQIRHTPFDVVSYASDFLEGSAVGVRQRPVHGIPAEHLGADVPASAPNPNNAVRLQLLFLSDALRNSTAQIDPDLLHGLDHDGMDQGPG